MRKRLYVQFCNHPHACIHTQVSPEPSPAVNNETKGQGKTTRTFVSPKRLTLSDHIEVGKNSMFTPRQRSHFARRRTTMHSWRRTHRANAHICTNTYTGTRLRVLPWHVHLPTTTSIARGAWSGSGEHSHVHLH